MNDYETENIGLMPNFKKEKKNKNKEQKLDAINNFYDMVENGYVHEFIIAGIDNDKQIVLAPFVENKLELLGLLEASKVSLINNNDHG